MTPGTLVLLSANPIHDTGGGQRSAQLAFEFLERGWSVVFVSFGEVTETIDLDLHFDHPRLVETAETDFRAAASDPVRLTALLADAPDPEGAAGSVVDPEPVRLVLLVQVPLPGWPRILRTVRKLGGVTVYDCIDRWDSELGWGWYDRSIEARVARAVDLRVASAPVLERHVGALAGGRVQPLANAWNPRVFDATRAYDRPSDLPDGRVVLYVGALWGGWMDWPLVGELARARPDLHFVFVGDHRGEGEGLPGNVSFLGLKPQRDLPAYLAHAEVGLLPWTADDVTQATSPLKVYEYLAMGLPVLGPEIEPLRGLPATAMVSGANGFLEVLERWVPPEPATSDPDARMEIERSARAFAAEHSWTARVDALLGWIQRGEATPGWGPRPWWRRWFGD